VLMHALAASCEELRARTGNPHLVCNIIVNEGLASRVLPVLNAV
jgi:hypothetical protein